MAEVFKCRLSGMGGFSKLVVVKRIRPALAHDPTFLDMFLDEARIAANLCHPNIVQTFEIDEAEGVPYIAMEYVRGPTLALVNREERKRHKPSRGVVARVLAGICAGLQYAHKAVDEHGRALNIIHRDVSPQNVIISMDGMPKLLDFGVAKARGQLAQTRAGTLKGKLKYMAPEQFALGADVTPAIDVFAVGVCLYEATTLTLPYAGDTELGIMRNVAAGRFKKPSEVVPGYDPRLEEIILWAMAGDPAERCPDAATLQRALEDYATREGVEQLDVARYLGELFPEASAESTLQTAYVDVDSNDILGPPESLVHAHARVVHTQPERPRTLQDVLAPPLPPAPRHGAPFEIDGPPRQPPSVPRHGAHFELDEPPRESRAPMWGALIAVSLVAMFALGIAVSRPRVAAPAPVSMNAPPAAEAPPPSARVAKVPDEPQRKSAELAATAEVRRVEALLAAAHEALSDRRYVEAAELARRALAEHLDEPRATALLLEATARERERVRANAVLLQAATEQPKPAPAPAPAPAPVPAALARPRVVHARPMKLALAREPSAPEAAAADAPEPATPAVDPPAPLPEETPPVTPAPQPLRTPLPAAAPTPKAVVPAAPLPAAAASAPDIECPDGARLIVHSSPREAWCEVGGEREGPYLRLWPNGLKAIEGEYRRGKKHGRWLEFYEQGGERSRVEWRRGVQLW